MTHMEEQRNLRVKKQKPHKNPTLQELADFIRKSNVRTLSIPEEIREREGNR